MNILQVVGVTKRFGGVQALAQVTFDLPGGQILGLIGPNGAGKTTLFDVLSGVYRPEEGRVIFRDRDVTGLAPYRLARLGLARTHQIVRPLNDLTVRENVTVGACFGRENLRLRAAGQIADEVLALVGLAAHSHQLASSLNLAEKKRLEVARALAARPYLLLLDEVLAGLNQTEIAAILDVIRAIRGEGVSIIMIEHVIQAVMSLAERLLVLDYGQQIAAGPPEEVARDQRVIEAYLGKPELAAKLMALDGR